MNKVFNLNIFIESYLPLLEAKYEITHRANGSYTLNTKEFGIIDIYPLSQRLLIRRDNSWRSNAFSIIDKFIL